MDNFDILMTVCRKLERGETVDCRASEQKQKMVFEGCYFVPRSASCNNGNVGHFVFVCRESEDCDCTGHKAALVANNEAM